jgi:hypothetical protein
MMVARKFSDESKMNAQNFSLAQIAPFMVKNDSTAPLQEIRAAEKKEKPAANHLQNHQRVLRCATVVQRHPAKQNQPEHSL